MPGQLPNQEYIATSYLDKQSEEAQKTWDSMNTPAISERYSGGGGSYIASKSAKTRAA